MAKPDDNQDKPEKKKKLSFKEKLKLVFNGVSRKEAKAVMGDTLKELRKPREIGILLVSCFVPGGWIGYAAYRIARYKFKQEQDAPANDNAGTAAPGHKIAPDKLKKPKKPKKGQKNAPPAP